MGSDGKNRGARPNFVVVGLPLEKKGKGCREERRCIPMRKKITVLLATGMMLLITAFPAMAAPPAAADFGLHTAHEAIPEGVPGHEHVPHPSS
jgi:hypothetical protein